MAPRICVRRMTTTSNGEGCPAHLLPGKRAFIELEEDSDWVYVAVDSDHGGPSCWVWVAMNLRNGEYCRPEVYAILRGRMASIYDAQKSATELMQRIAKGGAAVTAIDPVARMVADAKVKQGHDRDTYLQTYNNGVVGTVDTSYAGGNVVQMANVSFGARLVDIYEHYQITDANLNVVGSATVTDKQSNSIGAGDTVTLAL